MIERHTLAVAYSCDESGGGKSRCRFGDLLHDIFPVMRRTDDGAHRTTKDTTRRAILSRPKVNDETISLRVLDASHLGRAAGALTLNTFFVTVDERAIVKERL